MPNIGDIAPDFELPNQDGKMIKLSDYRGKRVVIFAFTRAGTAGCTAQACALRDEFDELKAANAEVITVSDDTQQALAQFKKNRRLPYDLLSDTQHTMLKPWGAYGASMMGIIKLPMTLHSLWVIDENGVVVESKVALTSSAVTQSLKALQKLPDAQPASAGD